MTFMTLEIAERGSEPYKARIGAAVVWIAVMAAVIGIVSAVMWLPPVVVGAELPDSVPKGSVPLTESERLAAISSVRQHLLWAAGGLIAIITLLFTWRRDQIARIGANLDRDSNFTSRYTEAITQLGSGERSIRLGGIYALERIAIDSRRDHQTILDVLAAFVRSSAPRQTVASEVRRMDEDVSAAVAVLGRLSRLPRDRRPVDLNNTQLNGADLRGACLHLSNLAKADLTGADLSHADLTGAELTSSVLVHADLTGANLTESKLQRADLSEAVLVDALLIRASMPEAVMRSARLTGADLSEAMMWSVKISDASLFDAKLIGADLRKADFSRSALKGIDVTGADLSETDLSPFDAHGVDLSTTKT